MTLDLKVFTALLQSSMQLLLGHSTEWKHPHFFVYSHHHLEWVIRQPVSNPLVYMVAGLPKPLCFLECGAATSMLYPLSSLIAWSIQKWSAARWLYLMAMLGSFCGSLCVQQRWDTPQVKVLKSLPVPCSSMFKIYHPGDLQILHGRAFKRCAKWCHRMTSCTQAHTMSGVHSHCHSIPTRDGFF